MRPTAAMLAGLDALVFDMQDVGTRYYTYPTTMAYAMEAAAQNQLDFFVLDRPDPITAATVQGPVLDADLTSFITYMPLPVRYGMTIGELARLFNAEKNLGAKLHVVTMRRYGSARCGSTRPASPGWRPRPTCAASSRRSLYPGVGMAEGGQRQRRPRHATPFELVGAPWIDGKALADQLNARGIAGVRFEAATFTPSQWVYPGQSCGGIRITLTDRNRFDYAPARHRADRGALSPLWRPLPDRPHGRMIGSRASLDAIKAQTDPRDIARSWTPGPRRLPRTAGASICCIDFAGRRDAGLEARGPLDDRSD